MPASYSFFLNLNYDTNEVSISELNSPSFISSLHFIVFLSGSIITLPSVSSYTNSAISDNTYAPGVIVEYNFGVPLLYLVIDAMIELGATLALTLSPELGIGLELSKTVLLYEVIIPPKYNKDRNKN